MGTTRNRLLPLGLYGMADASQGDPLALGLWLFERGVRVVQLRAKGADTTALTDLARPLARRADAVGGMLIVNDSIEAAAAAGAQGVHLGQEDAPLAEARRALGPGAIIGRSTHTLAQVRAAQGADYLGFGPVFGTRTKAIAWSPDGAQLATTGVDQNVRIWDASTGQSLKILDGHQRVVIAVAWNASGTRIASGSLDDTVRVWDTSTSENLQTLEGLQAATSTVSWSPSGTRIAAGSPDGVVRIWESRMEEALPMWRAQSDR